MSIVRTHDLPTPEPVDLLVELRHGRVQLTATQTEVTRVRVVGADAPATTVVQREHRIEVRAPQHRSGFLAGADAELVVEVELPTASNAALRTASADIDATGSLASLQVRTGSGQVRVEELTGPSVVECGSGTVRIEQALGELGVKAGSGDVVLGRSAGATTVSTGSGDVAIDELAGPAVVKTGTGDLRVRVVAADLTLTTGSGDLTVAAATRGRLRSTAASGDVRVGVPAGVAVWTDVTTISGTVRSDLAGTGAPTAGQDHIELRATTVSGDIVLAPA